AAAAADADKQQPPRKRRRIVISCTECHRRKQKCDRGFPCTNCVSRNKQDSCRYETGAPTAKALQQQARRAGEGGAAEPPRRRGRPQDPAAGSVKAPTSFGYADASGTSGASTLGFLKKLDDGSMNPEGESLTRLTMPREDAAYYGTRERYKSLVRQMPARSDIERLADIYFKDFNWQYNAVDRYMFNRQAKEWYKLPFNLLNVDGPQALSPDLRAFPAMVFQILATSLLILPTASDPTFDHLKYNNSMSFEDLATDYTESGMALMNLLGKRQVSLTLVTADWLRAAFLKYSGLVTESWHAIGTAIRDAQECGLHRESLDPRPKSDNIEDILENQWEIQRRRKMWCLLVVWDVHTGIVLGRPLSVDLSIKCPLPVDAPEPKDPSRTPVVQRSDNDPPSLTTRTLYTFQITLALKDIVDLEKEGPCPKDFSKVDRLHEKLVELEAQTPAFFRQENPDTRFDNLADCFWVPMARSSLHPLVAFNFMALHRPYVFTRPHSRREALKASLKMLELQRANFTTMSPRHYKLYHLFFGTFDAIVLMASIFILFPKDNAEYLASALQHFQWAMERFEIMAERNRLAAAARGVLQAIRLRLKRALEMNGTPSVVSTTSSTPGSQPTASASDSNVSATTATTSESPSLTNAGSSGNRSTSVFTTPGADISPAASDQQYAAMSAGDAAPIDPGLAGMAASDWTLPDNFDWSSIQPLYAMADVAYNDLMGISHGGGGEI
ncbi:hypothetical protein M406DRAFT_226327, partial [Cryphonectria parasitica EP155]